MPQVRSDVGAQHAVSGKHPWHRAAYSRQSSSSVVSRDGWVGARYIVPGERAWHCAAHSAQICRFFVGARHAVPGKRAWHRAAHSRVSPHGTRNASHPSPLKTPQIAAHLLDTRVE